MAEAQMKIARLDDSGISRVRALEDELGVYIVALEPNYPLANLSEEQLQRIQALEQELGMVLLAHQRNAKATTH
ncbi:MAG: hypothetical protein OJF49_001238 [Ktedonobacterales bacterium]|jgi:sugar phosphate isomerase/epimerase|nr:MAG: hypothetical protein OJF49_001238 [Ktedonobacterales bacterium]